MKHLFRGLLLVAVILCCNFQQAFAQQMPPIPIDKNVRIGKLDNGLTYYSSGLAGKAPQQLEP